MAAAPQHKVSTPIPTDSLTASLQRGQVPRHRGRARLWRVLAVLIIVMAGAALAGWWRGRLDPVAEFETATVTRGSIEETVTALGKLEPRNYVGVGAQVSGQLTRLLVQPGDHVAAGQLLAEIDPQVLGAHDRLAIARDNLANAREVLRVVEARARDGAALTREVAQQQALTDTETAAIPPLAQAETEARTALALLLDRPPQAFAVRGTGLDGIAAPAVAPGLPAALLARRPDIAEAEAQLAAADANVAAARAAMLPRIDLSGLAGVQQAVVSGATGGSSFLYTLGAGVTRPIFDNGALAGQRDVAIGRREKLVARYRGAVNAAFADVEKTLQAIDHAAREATAQESEVAQSRRAFALAQTEYRAGAADLLTVLDTQRSLYAAQDALAQTRLARLQAIVALFKALGGGWQQGGSA
ncbi:MAG TPA: TolC family protein [Rhodopila sp.]